ncbi:CYTH domain-containing protein [Anaerobacillus isosaccharinicus]|uniref:CYTH domain-containing protein n=1 Tax=Anaerobacillus isosaccharinicus TaxID=1532552 RepID=A0A1S2L746_9BACI|nr:CYTH domain-containing protein [Anaerobacillus isosaccharinicus]MBA5587642.1 CYTH domain-containing protein [Anaerobacillus isosaccharinicus]QOY34184.1 CYTH domain-containing protein [Anaerobacillus isosaccharinicus]
MSQEIEIEYKNIVSQADFNFLCEKFSIKQTAFKMQENHYFDTNEFLLKKHGSALRIREKNGNYTLTLKQPNEIGLLETHQILLEEEAKQAFQAGHLPFGTVANQLDKSFQIDITKCRYLGSLMTKRAEISYLDGILVFDHSFYFNVEDFEIEYEVKDEKKGKQIFENLFLNYKIPIKQTDNKIKRFFLKKLEQG